MLNESELKAKYQDFWYIEEGDTVVPATDAQIAAAETKLGVKLPPDFVSLLKISNGGIPWLSKYVGRDDEYSLFSFFGASPREKGGCIVPPPNYDPAVHKVPKGIVIFSSESFSWFGLDYRQSKTEPSVVYYDEFEDKLTAIATDFRQFFAGLEED